MNIQVTPAPQQNLLGGPENMVTELKTSIFIAPGESLPGVKQYYQIAKTIAGFVNGAGGTLWLGVADDGKVKGVEGRTIRRPRTNTGRAARSARRNWAARPISRIPTTLSSGSWRFSAWTRLVWH